MLDIVPKSPMFDKSTRLQTHDDKLYPIAISYFIVIQKVSTFSKVELITSLKRMKVARFCAVQVVQHQNPAIHYSAVFRQHRDLRTVHLRISPTKM